MKIDQTHAVPPIGGPPPRASRRPPARREEETRDEAAEDEVVLFGIPQDQMTPEVRRAIDHLLTRLEESNQALRQARGKVADLEELADRDPLTPCRNRRAFLRELDRAMALAARHENALSLIYVDIDDLKTLNDREGHAAGDAALETVAELLDEHTRSSDVIGRIGGDEFLLLLPHTDGTAAMELAMRLAAAVEGAGGAAGGLSISYGVHQIDIGRENADAAIAAADTAMYAHKRQLHGNTAEVQTYAIISGSKASRTA